MENEEDEEEAEVEEAQMSEVKVEGDYPEEVVLVEEDALRSCEVNASTMQQLLAAV